MKREMKRETTEWTITFRPLTEVGAALDAVCERRGDRARHINAALVAYFGLDGSARDDTQAGTGQRQGARRGKPPRGAAPPASSRRAAEPEFGVDQDECPHPRDARKQMGWGSRCGLCGKVIRR